MWRVEQQKNKIRFRLWFVSNGLNNLQFSWLPRNYRAVASTFFVCLQVVLETIRRALEIILFSKRMIRANARRRGHSHSHTNSKLFFFFFALALLLLFRLFLRPPPDNAVIPQNNYYFLQKSRMFYILSSLSLSLLPALHFENLDSVIAV